MLLRSKPKPRLRNADRMLWVWMRQLGGVLHFGGPLNGSAMSGPRPSTSPACRRAAKTRSSRPRPLRVVTTRVSPTSPVIARSGELESGTGEGWARNSPSTAGPAEPMLPERSLREKCLRGRK